VLLPGFVRLGYIREAITKLVSQLRTYKFRGVTAFKVIHFLVISSGPVWNFRILHLTPCKFYIQTVLWRLLGQRTH